MDSLTYIHITRCFFTSYSYWVSMWLLEGYLKQNSSILWNILFMLVCSVCWSLFVHLLKQQIQKRYKQWYRSQLPSIFLLLAYWCWWCWRCWLGPGAQLWGAPCAQEQHQGGSGNLSRRPSQSCRRGDTRWWCSVTPCALKSFQIQPQSSFLECRITFKTWKDMIKSWQ